MKIAQSRRRVSAGFTLIEMLVIAPIVILAIGAFITVIVSITGEVLSSRGSNVLAYDVQDALNQIEDDVKLSSGFLATNTISFNASNNPQGYGAVGSTTNFTNTGGTSGTSLILASAATDGIPLSTSSKMIYLANEPNDCSTYAEYSKNKPMLTNIIYFVDSAGTLWRRTVMPYGYDNSSIRCGTKAPWQQPSCQVGYTNAFCKTNDVRLVDGVGSTGLTINYFSSANSSIPSTSATDADPAVRKAALQSIQTISVSINATDTIAGRDVSRGGTLRVTRLDTNASAIADTVVTTTPSAPTVSSSVTNGSTVTFTWPRVASATSYPLEYNINGGSWIAASPTLGASDRSYSVMANHEDTVNVRVKAANSAGQSTLYGTNAIQIPFWAPLLMANGWSQYGTGYGNLEFSRTSAGLVTLKGMVKKSSAVVPGEVIATLPPSYRPTGKLMFGTITNSNATGRIEINTNGDVVLSAGDAGYVSLDPIRFVADNTGFSHLPSYTRTALTYSNGWSNTSGWATGSFVTDNRGRVVMQGMATSGTKTAGTLFITLPSAQRAAKYQVMPGKSSTFNQLVIGSSGVLAAGDGTGDFTLNNLWFPASVSPTLTWTGLTMQNSWVSYDSGSTYEIPQYSKTTTENMVSLKGNIKSGTTTDGTIVATLPAGFRPEGRLVFPAANNGNLNHIDILANGEIRIVGTGMGNTLQSLNGITFHADQ